MLRAFVGLWFWVIPILVSMIGFTLCGIIFIFAYPFDKTRKLTGSGIRLVGRIMCRAVPMWDFGYMPPVPEKLPRRCVCVSNHSSNVDPFLLGFLPWEKKFLAKSSLFYIPFIGWGIGIAGDIPLVRGSSGSIKRAMKRASWYVRNGMPVLIFPEGTRSQTGDLLPFKDGAFRLAIETQAHILPIAVAGTVGAMTKGDWRPGKARGSIAVGEPISAEGMTVKDMPELKERTRAAIVEQRERLRQAGYG